MKKAFQIMAGIFGILAVILYFVSIKEVSSGGYSIQVANIQATVFAAASAIMCAINTAGAMIVSVIEGGTAQTNNDISMCLTILKKMEPSQTSKSDEHTTKPKNASSDKQDHKPMVRALESFSTERDEIKEKIKKDILQQQDLSFKSFYEFVKVCDSATEIMDYWNILPFSKEKGYAPVTQEIKHAISLQGSFGIARGNVIMLEHTVKKILNDSKS